LIPPQPFRAALLGWYDRVRRNLPWRQSSEFYGVWVSEIMLQQTRVEAVVPYYQRFLERFPDVTALARAAEQDVLTAWSGLGYYSRARNLQRAARKIVAAGLPGTYEQIMALPGAGPYTAAAIASIALKLPHAAVDGNVMRVISRLTNDSSEISLPATRRAFTEKAQRLIDPQRPGDFNQAMMELGATTCVPGVPRCGDCPVNEYCAARRTGTERELPIKVRVQKTRDVRLELVLLERERAIFLSQRREGERRLAGFWELPEKNSIRGIRARMAAEFSHQIVNDRFRVRIWRAIDPEAVPEGRWFDLDQASLVPLTTVTKKALQAVNLFPARHAGGQIS